MKTILSFQDDLHRVQLVECDPFGSSEKYVIYDNRKVVQTFLADESNSRKFFHLYIGNYILQKKFVFPN